MQLASTFVRRSWQYLKFDQTAMAFIRIVGTHNTANEVFHCVHFECPAVDQSHHLNTSARSLSSTSQGDANPFR